MSERGGTLIKNYLTEINNKLNELAGSDMDVVSVVPLDTLKKDLEFFDYVVSSNESIADRQTLYLEKYKIFARNQGQIDSKQADLREKCMQY
uniref:Cap-specific mRNA (nucleoside-2'-O-)-methyltransferase 1 n=1 Tax=Plectus sambesii TaxID=2011161 RepID=A0A914VFS0_9BILA